MDNTDQPSSICHVGAEQIYPITPLDPTISLPFILLCGEAVQNTGHSSEGLLVLTNYRIYIELGESQHHVPLGLIEIVEHREMFYLHIGCKDARSYKCTFDNNEQCLEWFGRLMKASSPPRELEDLFAFRFYAWASERGNEEILARLETNCPSYYDGNGFKSEVERLRFDLHGAWRISQANAKYKLCGSYPPLLLVPACITDETLETVARFRSSRRIPAVVWRHQGNGAVIARCSQPEVGWLGWRSGEDEDLLKAIADACNFDRGPRSMFDNNPHTPTSSVPDDSTSTTSSSGGGQELTNVPSNTVTKKVLIMDARSYTTAVANRARGGGCECPEYYPSCEIQFMNLANIHSIRKSFHALRQLCASNADQPNWFGLLEGTRWLQHMSGLMRAAETLVAAVERDARPVLVHCSDGWDRTPQIVALAELLLDPFYRTVDGFRILVEREWLSFGHKFADRCGHAAGTDDQNERCPVFLQWLDCVHQLIKQYPCHFQFSHTYLVKLAQHTYSNLFGTFLCNTKQDRVDRVCDKTFSVWKFLNTTGFRNHLYSATTSATSSRVIWPLCNVRDLRLWGEVYLGSLEARSGAEGGPSAYPGPPGSSPPHMTKTRSYGDLIGAADALSCPSHYRRSSDPSITVDIMKLSGLGMSQCDNDIPLAGDEVVGAGGAPPPPPPPPTPPTTNGHSYNNSFENETLMDNCNSDCMFKNDVYDVDSKRNEYIENSASWQSHNNVKLPQNVIRLTETDKLLVEALRIKNNHHIVDGLLTTTTTTTTAAQQEIENGLADVLKQDEDTTTTTTTTLIDKELTSDINHNGFITDTDGEQKKRCDDPKCFADVVVEDDCEEENGGGGDDDDEEEEENEDRSESKSEATLCDNNVVAAVVMIARRGSGTGNRDITVQSVETSTETLVAENGVISRTSLEEPSATTTVVDGAEPQAAVLAPPPVYTNGVNDVCRVCAQNRKFITDKHAHNNHHHPTNSGSTSGKNSRYSTPPLYSRTPSVGGAWDANQRHHHFHHAHPSATLHSHYNQLEVDGMKALRCDTQNRLSQIVEEFRIKEEALQRELHTTRQALIQQVCHHCSHNDGDKQDDTGSVVDSVCSAGECQISAGESLPSDMSWEAVEDGPGSDALPTLWVPDHAVSRCTGCQTEFWLGRRKHHCRNCGRIFCADCSENSTPLPSEHLFTPVRVCTTCYCQLRTRGGGCGEIPDHCKHPTVHANGGPPQQIAASSN